MKIWLVNTDMENTCAWSTKKQAVNYFKEECAEYDWTWRVMYDGNEENPESCLSYLVTTKEGYKLHIDIYCIPFNEKPTLDDI